MVFTDIDSATDPFDTTHGWPHYQYKARHEADQSAVSTRCAWVTTERTDQCSSCTHVHMCMFMPWPGT